MKSRAAFASGLISTNSLAGGPGRWSRGRRSPWRSRPAWNCPASAAKDTTRGGPLSPASGGRRPRRRRPPRAPGARSGAPSRRTTPASGARAFSAASIAGDLGLEGREDLRKRARVPGGAQIELEAAFAGQDVAGRAAVQDADRQGRALGREGRGGIGVGPAWRPAYVSVSRSSGTASITAETPRCGLAGVASRPLTVTWKVAMPLWPFTASMSVGSPTTTSGRLRQFAGDDLDHVRRAQAADLLVIGEGQVHRLLAVLRRQSPARRPEPGPGTPSCRRSRARRAGRRPR
jgi:hypothetical protein